MQSKDVILAPLVTIWHHWLLEKEKEKAKWERMTGKLTLRRTEGDVNTQTLETHKRVLGSFSLADTQHAHTASICTEHVCARDM